MLKLVEAMEVNIWDCAAMYLDILGVGLAKWSENMVIYLGVI